MSSDLARTLANLIRYGTVESVTTKPARVRVRVGGLLTAPLRWATTRSGKSARTWMPPSIGEQVLVFSAFGEMGNGVAFGGIPSTLLAPPDGASADNVMIAFDDGAVLLYDHVKHLLQATLPGGGRVELTAPGGLLMTADVEIDGRLTVTKDVEMQADAHATGTITGDKDVIAAGVSGKNHMHDKTQRGSDMSGKPVAT